MKILQYMAVVLMLNTWACTTQPDIPARPEVSFQSDIQAVLTGSCGQSNCHAKNGSKFSLIGYDDVISHAEVVKGDARASLLYKVISNRSSNEMPPKPAAPMATSDIQLIYVWIEQGAKNN